MSGVRRRVLAAVLLAAVVLALLALWDSADGLGDAARELSVVGIAAATAAALGSLVLNVLTWRAMLGALGQHLPLGASARIFFVGQLGKYLPGSVWPAALHAELATARGLTRTTTATASLLSLLVGVPGALLLGALAVPALLDAGAGAYAVLLLLLPVVAALLWPPVLNRLVEAALRLLRRPPLQHEVRGLPLARVAALSAGANVLLGLHAVALAVDLGASGGYLVPAVVGAYVLASVAGLLAVPLPAGAGVREVVLVAALSPVLPVDGALLLAVVSRLVLTAADLGVAALASRLGDDHRQDRCG